MPLLISLRHFRAKWEANFSLMLAAAGCDCKGTSHAKKTAKVYFAVLLPTRGASKKLWHFTPRRS